jgi:hypothetical protein
MGHKPHLGRDIVSQWALGDPMLAIKRPCLLGVINGPHPFAEGLRLCV